jgi:MoxR-like ATPase
MSSLPGNDRSFKSPDDAIERLRAAKYLADPRIGLTVYIAQQLQKPLLVEGPAGVGKTELARSVALATGARLIRLQCYEGLDESKALYEWNYKKQLLRIQADDHREAWSELEVDIFSEAFLLPRPLLSAIRADEPIVLLIDEIDRVEVEAEALMLEVLADFQVTIPELGTISATRRPMVFLTSNDTRDLSEALKRRCLFLQIDYPSIEREREILLTRVEGLSPTLADQVSRIVRSVRELDLKKPPSISESLDWARTLVLLGIESIAPGESTETLHVLLKYEADIEKARRKLLGLPEEGSARPVPVDAFRAPEDRGA